MTEPELVAQFIQEGLRPTRWSNGPHAVYAVHDHPYHKVLYVVEGSIAFTMGSTGRRVAMQAGDRLEVPPHTPHSAVVGLTGVVCLEAQHPPTHPS